MTQEELEALKIDEFCHYLWQLTDGPTPHRIKQALREAAKKIEAMDKAVSEMAANSLTAEGQWMEETKRLRDIIKQGVYGYDVIPYQMATEEINRLQQPTNMGGFWYRLDDQAIDDMRD